MKLIRIISISIFITGFACLLLLFYILNKSNGENYHEETRVTTFTYKDILSGNIVEEKIIVKEGVKSEWNIWKNE